MSKQAEEELARSSASGKTLKLSKETLKNLLAQHAADRWKTDAPQDPKGGAAPKD